MPDIQDIGTTQVRRDRWGRYLLPDPDTGIQVAWTRATTWAKTVADQFGLTKWQCRMVAKGVAMRPDLYALAAATAVDDKATFDRLVEDAKEAAAASAGAKLGSALHTFAQRIDMGDTPAVPEPWNADVAAYRAALADAGVLVDPALIERIVVVPELGVAGTLDRVLEIPGVGPVIGDLKTAQTLQYSWGEISIQLALYANAESMWNPATGEHEPMPRVDRERALVVHLPAGRGRCELHWVDIASGWGAAALCGQVRAWRARRDLATPFGSTSADALRAEVAAATTVTDLFTVHGKAMVAGLWNDDLRAACIARKHELLDAAS